MAISPFRQAPAVPAKVVPVLLEHERNFAHLTSDGKVLVSQSHKDTAHCRSMMARFARIGVSVEVENTSMELVNQARSDEGGIDAAGKKERDESYYMGYAKDLFSRAAYDGASDIHIVNNVPDNVCNIYFRILGDKVRVYQETAESGSSLLRVIYQSLSEVSSTVWKENERQDAKIGRKHSPKGVAGIRVATTPHVEGQGMFLRLLHENTSQSNDLAQLGYCPDNRDQIVAMRAKPTGINIICGPTGSGKSTTLQRVLGGLIDDSKGRLNVITVEDPPEYPIPGSLQCQVGASAEGSDARRQAFIGAIRSAMRCDPDVMMIGEIRDAESADVALKAAQTGHQVWTTLHANDAMLILDRMTGLGIDMDLLADPTTLTGLISQRLIKVLCPECKLRWGERRSGAGLLAAGSDEQELNRRVRNIAKGVLPPEVEERIIQVIPLEMQGGIYTKGDGCDHCKGRGFSGRAVCSEVISPDAKFLQLIRQKKKEEAREHWLSNLKGKTYLISAIEKIVQGIADPVAVEAVVGPISEAAAHLSIMESNGRKLQVKYA